MIYFCTQKERRAKVLSSALTGIDYLEVLGDPGCGRELAVTMLKDARPLALTPANIVITVGAPVHVLSISPATDEAPFVVTINLDATGDFSTYSFAFVAAPGSIFPPDGFDPQLSSVNFSFKGGCPTPADCLPADCCPNPRPPEPDINYLAKDFDGFRQVMLDRLSVIAPAWRERHAADLGIAMVETLAYAADHLSYAQDSASTEGYLGTARSRISLRRLARLVDYRIGEGCNARAWVVVTCTTDGAVLPQGSQFYVRAPGLPAISQQGDAVERQLVKTGHPIFASLDAATLYMEQNTVRFYTWGDDGCCLPKGATSATLLDNLTHLQPGDVLLFEEVLGPSTGEPRDADVTHRWAVRLTGVLVQDGHGQPLTDPLTDQPITQVEWSPADALPFPLCISWTTDTDHGARKVEDVSVARGNVVAADHGVWVHDEVLGAAPPPPPAVDPSTSCSCGTPAPLPDSYSRYNPALAQSPLTFTTAYDSSEPASAFVSQSVNDVSPAISLQSDDNNAWDVPFATDLLTSGPFDRVFVPEIERDDSAHLRFGDGSYGAAPLSGLDFTATYRVGNGTAGNIGHDTLAHVAFPASVLPAGVGSVRNPLAAAGGIDPEGMEHIRQHAPFAYETQLRCVTESDYAEMAMQSPGVSEARGTLRWTGSWYTAFVSVAPGASPSLVDATTKRLDLLRMMGTDLAIEGATIVGLRIELQICVDGSHFQGDVYSALMAIFVTGDQCSGRSGLLNASNFGFGETIFASPLIAAAQSVQGVRSVTLSTFGRMDDPSVDGVALGYLKMGRLEIPHCDNDPNNLDHGIFVLHMSGGK